MSAVWIDGAAVPAEAARISALGDGFQFGYGVFETVRIRDGRPVAFEDHAARIAGAAGQLGLASPEPGPARERCFAAAQAAGCELAALKWILHRREDGRTGEVILTRPYPYLAEDFARGFALRARPWSGGGPLKSLAYLPHLLARRGARAAGADEALYVDLLGDVLEGSATNVFAVEAGRVLTPPCDGRILPGVARARLARIAGAVEVRISLARLLEADEVFVTNALLGVMPVRQIDDRSYLLRHDSPTARLRSAYEDTL